MTATRRATLRLDDSAPAPPVAWYRRKSLMVPAVTAVILAAIVLSDLPQANSRASEVANSTTIIRQVNGYVGPCSFALSESFTIFHDLRTASLSPSEQSRVPTLLNDDQSACSFTSDSIYNLSTMDVPGGTYGNALGQVVSAVTLWATSDALAAIEEIQALDATPSDSVALKGLDKDERALEHDRSLALAGMKDLARLLRAQLPALRLVSSPVPSSLG